MVETWTWLTAPSVSSEIRRPEGSGQVRDGSSEYHEAMDYVEPSAPLWQTLLGVFGFAAGVILPVLLALWGRRRRARGEEASADTTKGAESILYTHGRNI